MPVIAGGMKKILASEKFSFNGNQVLGLADLAA